MGRAPPVSWAPRALWPRWKDGVGVPPNGAVTEVTARPYKGCNIKTRSKREVSTLQGHRSERDLFQGLPGNFPFFFLSITIHQAIPYFSIKVCHRTPVIRYNFFLKKEKLSLKLCSLNTELKTHERCTEKDILVLVMLVVIPGL